MIFPRSVPQYRRSVKKNAKKEIGLFYAKNLTLSKPQQRNFFSKILLNLSVPLGSVPELPAISCQEIEASEGKYNISNKHWLDSSYTGQAELVDCSDTVKGEF